jgi:hypothetical protein
MKSSEKKNQKGNADLYISVESRKGGVGKTTAALCIARLLRKHGYKVMLLDLDITGTNAADIAKSPFWVDDIHIVQEMAGKNNSTQPLNLVTLFAQKFMAGKAIPNFSATDSKLQEIVFDFAKVNILGSQLYQTENADGITCINRPGILFDDLHTIWLIEFVKKIVNGFVRAAQHHLPARTAVIFDNSPGYVGIAPAIHEWLTDIGPESGKFLLVTSLDEQDLIASNLAISNLHRVFMEKWQISRQFISAKGKDSEFILKKEQEAFFVRLAMATEKDSSIDGSLSYYINGAKMPSSKLENRGQRYCDFPGMYIAAIINRVPRGVKTGNLIYEFPQGNSTKGEVLERVLFTEDGKKEWRNWMVSYDEYIENQFLLRGLQRPRGRSERRRHHLLEILEVAEKELDFGPERKIEAPELEGREFFERLREQLLKSHLVVSRARSAVEDAGLNHLSRLIHDDWLPGAIVPSFRSSLTQILRESEFPFFEIMPFDVDQSPNEGDNLEFIEML